MDNLMLRRRAMLNKSSEVIGYKPNMGFTGGKNNPSTGAFSGRFLTGFIPLNGATRVYCYYGGNVMLPQSHFLVEYNAEKEFTYKNGYWDINVLNQRTVNIFTKDAMYIMFSGFMTDINNCIVKNADTDEILWEKGM